MRRILLYSFKDVVRSSSTAPSSYQDVSLWAQSASRAVWPPQTPEYLRCKHLSGRNFSLCSRLNRKHYNGRQSSRCSTSHTDGCPHTTVSSALRQKRDSDPTRRQHRSRSWNAIAPRLLFRSPTGAVVKRKKQATRSSPSSSLNLYPFPLSRLFQFLECSRSRRRAQVNRMLILATIHSY